MRPILVLVLAIGGSFLSSRAATEGAVVKVEIYSGVTLELPGDWLIEDGKQVINAASASAGRVPPDGALLNWFIHPPGDRLSDALIHFSVERMSPERKKTVLREIEEAGATKSAPEAAKAGEDGLKGRGYTPKSPTQIERVLVSGRAGMATRLEGRKSGSPDSSLDGVYVCAEDTVIGFTAWCEVGKESPIKAALDRARTSLSLAARVPQVRKPYESAARSVPAVDTSKIAADSAARLFSKRPEKPATSGAVTEAWQSSWNVFAREVQSMYARKAPTEEFARRFNGKRVTWEGEVKGVAENWSNALRIRLSMPRHMIRRADGQEYRLEQLLITLPIGTAITPGKKMRFRATLAGSGPSSPAVSDVTLPSEKLYLITVSSLAMAEVIE